MQHFSLAVKNEEHGYRCHSEVSAEQVLVARTVGSEIHVILNIIV